MKSSLAVPVYLMHKGKREKYAIMRTPAQAARASISRENRQEYDNEKRAKELSKRMPDGHRHAVAVAISKMMCIPEHKARKLIESKNKGVVLDGKID
jgi:hypothetical protein